MLANFLFSLAVAVAILALLDLFMSEPQKAWLSNAVIKMWSVLDEARRWSFTEWLKNPRATWWFAITYALFNGIASLYEDFYEGVTGQNTIIYSIGQVLVGVFVVTTTRPIFGYIFQFKTKRELARRGCLASLLSLGAFLVAGVLLTFFTPSPEFPPLDQPWSKIQVISLVLASISLLMVACLVTLCLSICLAYIASALLFVGEFVVRRIAEYPKGPVLALSAFFGGIIALLKAFGLVG